jgi:serine/threonine-protein kinase ULK4
VAARAGSSECESFLQTVYGSLASTISSEEKLNVLVYIEHIIQNNSVANAMIKGSAVAMFMKLLRNSRTSSAKAKICEVLGLLIRHATVIDAEFAKLRLEAFLLELLKDKSDRVRKRAVAALGEYLFYAATQLDEGGSEHWEMPPGVYSSLTKILKGPEEETVKFYIVKTFENITAQSESVGKVLSTPENTSVTLAVYQATRHEPFRQSCLALIHHMVTHSPGLLEPAVGKLTLRHFEDGFCSLDANPKNVQFLVTLLIYAVAHEPRLRRELAS